MGDWKTAWDHVHFAGFLGMPMTLQFIWQGCDSLLAAPLVLDLVRFTERAWRAASRRDAVLGQLFQKPLGIDENGFGRQFRELERWAAGLEVKPDSNSGQGPPSPAAPNPRAPLRGAAKSSLATPQRVGRTRSSENRSPRCIYLAHSQHADCATPRVASSVLAARQRCMAQIGTAIASSAFFCRNSS